MKPHKAKGPINLIQSFSLLSFFSIAFITTVSAFLLSRFLTQNMLKRDAVVAMEFVQSNLQTMDVSAYFESEPPERIKRILERFFERIATMPEVVRSNVYNREGSIIWSNDTKFIGHRFSPNPQLGIALSGELAVSSGTSGKPEKGTAHLF